MKKLIPAITATLLLLCISLAFSNQNQHKGEMVLSISDSKTEYSFKASFYQSITPEITRYMDSCASILRTEDINFRIKTSGGNLAIIADKQSNAALGIFRIRKMCQGISDKLIEE